MMMLPVRSLMLNIYLRFASVWIFGQMKSFEMCWEEIFLGSNLKLDSIFSNYIIYEIIWCYNSYRINYFVLTHYSSLSKTLIVCESAFWIIQCIDSFFLSSFINTSNIHVLAFD